MSQYSHFRKQNKNIPFFCIWKTECKFAQVRFIHMLLFIHINLTSTKTVTVIKCMVLKQACAWYFPVRKHPCFASKFECSKVGQSLWLHIYIKTSLWWPLIHSYFKYVYNNSSTCLKSSLTYKINLFWDEIFVTSRIVVSKDKNRFKQIRKGKTKRGLFCPRFDKLYIVMF